MPTIDYRDKLIKELNLQIEEGSFYTLNDVNAVTKKETDVFDSVKFEQSSVFSGIARIKGFDMSNTATKNFASNAPTSYFDSVKIENYSLYRPMVDNSNNPLNKNISTYKPTYDLAVNGMAFLSANGGIVENPLAQKANIVNKVVSENKIVEDITSSDKYKVEPVALNTYKMVDIINDSIKPEEITFSPVPREYALTVRKNGLKEFLFREIDVVYEIKNFFKKAKCRIKNF